MTSAIQKQFSKLNEQLDQLLISTKDLSHDQFNYKPRLTSWSVAQVFHHLITAESHTNNYLRKKIQAGKALKNAGIGTWFKFMLMRAAMYVPIKFKAPAAVNISMEGEYEYEDLVRKWKSQRASLEEFLEPLDAEMARKLLFKHGSGIRLTMPQMLRWMQDHAGRHAKQIRRIRKDTDFPGFEEKDLDHSST